MLKEIWFGLSVLLIILIVVRPPKPIGIINITSKTDLLGSPSSAEKILNNVTFSLVALYCGIILNIYIYYF